MISILPYGKYLESIHTTPESVCYVCIYGMIEIPADGSLLREEVGFIRRKRSVKKNKDKIILNLPYQTDKKGFEINHLSNDDAAFEIIDEQTVVLSPSQDEPIKLHVIFNNEQDKNCFKFLANIDDLSRLQPAFRLNKDKLQITFFITRLSEEEIDKELFEDGIHLSDIDAKALVGIFLDNRYHG